MQASFINDLTAQTLSHLSRIASTQRNKAGVWRMRALDAETMRITAYGQEPTIVFEVNLAAECLELGTGWLPLPLALSVMGLIDNNATITLDHNQEGRFVKLSAPRTTSTLKYAIPEWAEAIRDDVIDNLDVTPLWVVDGTAFSTMVKRIADVTEPSHDIRPMLEHVRIISEGNKLRFSATDSYRLMDATMSAKEIKGDGEIFLRRDVVRMIAPIMANREVQVGLSGDNIVFTVSPIARIVITMPDIARYPDFSPYTQSPLRGWELDKKALINGVKLIRARGCDYMTVSVEGNQVSLFGTATDNKKNIVIETSVSAELLGEAKSVSVGCGVTLLLGLLGAMGDEKIAVGIEDGRHMVFSSEGWVAVLMGRSSN